MVDCKLLILVGQPTVLGAVKLSYNYNVSCISTIFINQMLICRKTNDDFPN